MSKTYENILKKNKKTAIINTLCVFSIICGTVIGADSISSASASIEEKKDTDISAISSAEAWAHLRRETGWVSKAKREQEKKEEVKESPEQKNKPSEAEAETQQAPKTPKKTSSLESEAEAKTQRPSTKAPSLESPRSKEKEREQTDSKLIKSILANRDFFIQGSKRRGLFTSTLSDYAAHRIFAVNSRLGEERIGVVFFSSDGMQETVVFNRKNGQALYKDIKILKKDVRLSMLKKGIPAADAFFLAQNGRVPLPSKYSALQGETDRFAKAAGRTAEAAAKPEYKQNGTTRPANENLVKDIVANREFFSRLGEQGKILASLRDEKYRLYSVNSKVGENYIGVVFLSSKRKQKATVFDRETLEILYENVKTVEKEKCPAMLGKSLSIADACFLARNIVSIHNVTEKSLPQPVEERPETAEENESAENTENAGIPSSAPEEESPSGPFPVNEPSTASAAPAPFVAEPDPASDRAVDDSDILERFKRETGWVSRIVRQKRKDNQ
jgi:hypothetical protein